MWYNIWGKDFIQVIIDKNVKWKTKQMNLVKNELKEVRKKQLEKMDDEKRATL